MYRVTRQTFDAQRAFAEHPLDLGAVGKQGLEGLEITAVEGVDIGAHDGFGFGYRGHNDELEGALS
jgi:hypothetical protein